MIFYPTRMRDYVFLRSRKERKKRLALDKTYQINETNESTCAATVNTRTVSPYKNLRPLASMFRRSFFRLSPAPSAQSWHYFVVFFSL